MAARRTVTREKQAAESRHVPDPMDRREFLRWTTWGLGAALAGGVPTSLAQNAGAGVEPLSVGFVAGSEEWRWLRRMPWEPLPPPDQPWTWTRPQRRRVERLQVVPAAKLAVGDQQLALSRVRVRVHGLYPGMPSAAARSFRTANLVIWIKPDDPLLPEVLPFFCWGARRKPGWTAGAPIAFPLELDASGGLELTLEVGSEQGAGGEARQLHTRFTVDWEDGQPKLQRGAYLLALNPQLWDDELPLLAPDDPLAQALVSVAISIDPIAEVERRGRTRGSRN